MDEVRQKFRAKHYSYRTEQAYCEWIKRFILFHGKRHPREMGAAEVERFLSYLASERRVSASTQTQALSALLFLYRHVLEVELPWIEGLTRAKPSQRVPIVLSREEVAAVLARLSGRERLMAALMYGTGQRLMECLRLRIQSPDFGYRQITVVNGKGGVRQSLGRASVSGRRRTRFATLLRRTCWSPATTSARFRRCWATRT
jgi:integrase